VPNAVRIEKIGRNKELVEIKAFPCVPLCPRGKNFVGREELLTPLPLSLSSLTKLFTISQKIFLHLWKFPVISQLRTNFAENAQESLPTLGAA